MSNIQWPIIELELLQIDFTKINDILVQHLFNIFDTQEIHDQVSSLWSSIIKDGASSPQMVFLSTVAYLFRVEGLYSSCIDLIVFFLIREHHDLWNRNQRITEFDDLKRVRLFTKLNFIEQHGFPEVVKIYNRDLRNSIAHHEFSILSEGNIRYKKQGQWETLSHQELRLLIINIETLYAFINTYETRSLPKVHTHSTET